MDTLGKIILLIILIYIAVCSGKIATKHGKNPLLFGILSIITPINLIILGCWAFSGTKEEKKLTKNERRYPVNNARGNAKKYNQL